MSSLSLLPDAVVAGVCTGSVYALVALGYNITYNATGVFNLAQGDLVMIGLMLTWVAVGIFKIPYILAFLVVVAIVALVALIEERLVVRPFLVRREANIGWFISTLGFSIVIEAVALILFNNHPIVPIPSFLPQSGFHILGVLFVPRELLVFAALLVLSVGFEFFFKKTRMGLTMQATAEDRQAAGLRGVNPIRIGQMGFLLGGVVAGVAGFAVAPLVSTSISVGLSYSVKGFVALAVGGFGNLRAGVIAALLLGVAESVFDLFVGADYEIAVGLVILLVVLGLKPTGVSRSLASRQV
ncbi:MAG: branched-chain amino acid transport system permease protein [Pseudonocardiales bacterium]|nr:branched-chain amino acid transport system permease protein [Pseudonocardiales bacterium]